jgi:peroxiredoxin Q/BCP
VLQPGTTAPDFTLPSHDGGSIKLSDLRGKWVLLWWYPMADTPG